jgi:hypothetical protein
VALGEEQLGAAGIRCLMWAGDAPICSFSHRHRDVDDDDDDETYGFFRVSAFLTAHTVEMRLRFDSFRSGVQMTKRVSSALVSFVKKQYQNQ